MKNTKFSKSWIRSKEPDIACDSADVALPLRPYICDKSCLYFKSIFFTSVLPVEVGTNTIISKAQCNKVQQYFQPVKVRHKRRNLIFLFLKRRATSTVNFLIHLKCSAIVQLQSSIFEPSLSATQLQQLKFYNAIQILHFL